MTGYEAAKAKYEALGVDTDRAIERLKKVPVSLHCWQLDDVIGFDNDGRTHRWNPDDRKLSGARQNAAAADGGHGGGNEADAGNGKIKYSCILCDF